VFLNSIKGNNMAVMGKNKKNWSLNDKIKKAIEDQAMKK